MKTLQELEAKAAKAYEAHKTFVDKNQDVILTNSKLFSELTIAKNEVYREQERVRLEQKAAARKRKRYYYPSMVIFWANGFKVDTRDAGSAAKVLQYIESFGVPTRYESRG